MQCASANIKPQTRQGEISAVDVKKRLLEQGETIASAARSLGYARNTVSLAIHHPTLFPAVRARLLQYLSLL